MPKATLSPSLAAPATVKRGDYSRVPSWQPTGELLREGPVSQHTNLLIALFILNAFYAYSLTFG